MRLSFSKIPTNCNNCEIIVYKKRSHLKKNKFNFCSKKCHNCFRSKKGVFESKCSFCKKKLIKNNSEKNKSNQYFCDRKCYGLWKKNGFFVKCNNCNLEKYIISFYKKNKNHFCNTKCFSDFRLKNKNIFKTKNKSNYKSKKKIKDHTINYRNKALNFYGEKCQNKNCILKNHQHLINFNVLDVDHIDSDRKNNYINNLCVLCVFCHRKKTLKKEKIILENHEKKEI